MSWEKMFKSSVGHRVVSKVDRARQEGYDEGYKNGEATVLVGHPVAVLKSESSLYGAIDHFNATRNQDLYLAEMEGYIKALENAVRAIEEMPPQTGRKQVRVAIQEQLEAKRQEMKEDQAQGVTDGR